jgi:transcriptional regulator with XRE-family HTH domain
VENRTHPLLRAIGGRIRSLRRDRGISQESLAGLADIDRSYMSSVERGLRNVSVLNVARIADALAVPIWELFRPHAAESGIAQPAPPAGEIEMDEFAVPHGPASAAPGGADWEPRYLSLG